MKDLVIEKSKRRMTKMRTQMLDEDPWWGVRSMNLKLVPDFSVPRGNLERAVEIRYNPEWVLRAQPFELKYLVGHQTDHAALDHPARRNGRRPDIWQKATDYVVNIGLADAGFRIPDGAYLDAKFRGWTADSVASYLLNEEQRQEESAPNPPSGGKPSKDTSKEAGRPTAAPESGDSSGDSDPNGPALKGSQRGPAAREPSEDTLEADSAACRPTAALASGDSSGDSDGTSGEDSTGQTANRSDGGGIKDNYLKAADGDEPCPSGEFSDAPMDAEKDSLTKMDWDMASEQAYFVARKAGKVPLAVETAREAQLAETDTDWLGELLDFFERNNPVNFTFRKPSRRVADFVMPGMAREELTLLIWGMDVSGSISRQIYRRMVEELQTALFLVNPLRVIVVQIDTKVHEPVTELAQGEDIDIPRLAAGGTYFQPLFDWIEANDYDPSAVVYLTDLESADTPVEPDYPVLWVTPNWVRKDGPFGKTIRIGI